MLGGARAGDRLRCIGSGPRASKEASMYIGGGVLLVILVIILLLLLL
jgi:hypothetical protein